MGNTQNKENYNTYFGHTVAPNGTQNTCKNSNQNYTKDGAFAFACPGATSINGECACGNNCVKDYDSNTCCQRLEVLKDNKGKVVNTYCVEDVNDRTVKFEPRTNLYDPNERGRYDETKEIINPSEPYTANNNPFVGASRYPPKQTPKPKATSPPTRVGSPADINYSNCNMANVTYRDPRYGNVVIPGNQLCNWYKSPVLKQ